MRSRIGNLLMDAPNGRLRRSLVFQQAPHRPLGVIQSKLKINQPDFGAKLTASLSNIVESKSGLRLQVFLFENAVKRMKRNGPSIR